jgi:hypothetical protein
VIVGGYVLARLFQSIADGGTDAARSARDQSHLPHLRSH